MLGKKINIDEYSIVAIAKCISKDYTNNFEVVSSSLFEKFAITKNEIKKDSFTFNYRKYKVDLLTGEKYYLEFDYLYDGINTLFIDSRQRSMPLSYVIKTDNNKMSKKELLKRCREFIISLNEKALDDNQKHIIDKVKDKEKILKLNNSKITYKEEE